MNNVIFNGIIRDIVKSHQIGDKEYSRANIITKRADGKEDILSIRFRTHKCKYKDGDNITIIANARTYSKQTDNGKSVVELYFFTNFESPTEIEDGINNRFQISGKVCKISPLFCGDNSRKNLHFILANNIIVDKDTKINSYLPCVAFDDIASELDGCNVGDDLVINGECHSRYYRKYNKENSEYEIKVAHELVVRGVERK